jgi:hypothetical protein
VKLADCPTCGAQRPFQRALGWGTFFACIVTGATRAENSRTCLRKTAAELNVVKVVCETCQRLP